MKQKVAFRKDQMEEALCCLNKIAGARPKIPILDWAGIKISKGILSISRIGCNMKSFTTVNIPAVGEDFAILVEAKKFIKQVESLPEGKTTLELRFPELIDDIFTGRGYTLSSGKTIFKGNSKSYAEYPNHPGASVVTNEDLNWKWDLSVKYDEFLNFMAFILKATNLELPENYTSGVLLAVKKHKRQLVSTDGRRLHVVPFVDKIKKDCRYLVPAEDIRVLTKKQFGNSSTIRFGIVTNQGPSGDEKKYFMWECEGYKGATSLLDCPYPDYEKVFPEPRIRYKINPELMLEHLKPIKAIAHEMDGRDMVVIEGNRDTIRMSAKSDLAGRIETETECEFISKVGKDGWNFKIALNCDYLSHALESSEDGNMTMEVSGSNQPVMFEYGDDCDWVSIVMPVRSPE